MQYDGEELSAVETMDRSDEDAVDRQELVHLLFWGNSHLHEDLCVSAGVVKFGLFVFCHFLRQYFVELGEHWVNVPFTDPVEYFSEFLFCHKLSVCCPLIIFVWSSFLFSFEAGYPCLYCRFVIFDLLCFSLFHYFHDALLFFKWLFGILLTFFTLLRVHVVFNFRLWSRLWLFLITIICNHPQLLCHLCVWPL